MSWRSNFGKLVFAKQEFLHRRLMNRHRSPKNRLTVGCWILIPGPCATRFAAICLIGHHSPSEKQGKFSDSEEELVKRTGFVLMAEYAVHQEKAPDEIFNEFLQIIEHKACDDRNFVKKAVNWALRQIGKRNANLMQHAIQTVKRLALQHCKASKWVSSNALIKLARKASATNS